MHATAHCLIPLALGALLTLPVGTQAAPLQAEPSQAGSEQAESLQTAPAQSGPAQTAEGAQAFLRTMVERGYGRFYLTDAQNRVNYVEADKVVKTTRILLRVKEEEQRTPSSRNLPFFMLNQISSGDGQSNDPCTTLVEKFTVRPEDLYVSSVRSWHEPGLVGTFVSVSETTDYTESWNRFGGTHAMDWRRAIVERSNDGTQVHITAPNPTFKSATLVFIPGTHDMADRIDYAARFLQMSCDEAAATGF